MYDIDRYYREKIFVKFDTEEEFDRFCDEAKIYAKANRLDFGKRISYYGEETYYTASWNNKHKVLGVLEFRTCSSRGYIADLNDWYIVNAKELEVFNFDPGEVLEFIGV